MIPQESVRWIRWNSNSIKGNAKSLPNTAVHHLLHYAAILKYHNTHGENLLEYADSEQDIGVLINLNFSSKEQFDSESTVWSLIMLKGAGHFMKDHDEMIWKLPKEMHQLNSLRNRAFIFIPWYLYSRANLLPLAPKFVLNGLVLFHKIVYRYNPVDPLKYMEWFSGHIASVLAMYIVFH